MNVLCCLLDLYARAIQTSRQEGKACRGVGEGQKLVEADAGYVGGMDGGGVVEVLATQATSR